MRLAQIDRILSLEKGEAITAVKGLALSEEYLKDHFPRFPVMPGVLMLESMFQAAMYLLRASDDFAHSMVVLKEARNFKFNGFVQPGDQLVVTAKIQSVKDGVYKIKTEGQIAGKPAVSGIMFLEQFNLADRGTGAAATDDHMISEFKKNYQRLFDQINNPVSTAVDG
ncbi:MAG: 3-hydroxyacyl-ACP dehydratase FabZ family protein [Pirellulaceae bacterium]